MCRWVYNHISYTAFWGKRDRLEDLSTIENGIETIGTVIQRGVSVNNNGARSYGLKFDFFIGNKKVIVFEGVGVDTYDKAIIGMKYSVYYIESSPKKAVICLDNPIESEYCNIEYERRRIVETYSKKMLYNARSLNALGITIPQK